MLVDQIQVVTDASDIRRFPYAALAVAGFRGDEKRARDLVETTNKESLPRGEGLATTVSSWATAVLCNGRGRYEEAFRAAKEAIKDTNDLWYWGWGAVELIEAASRTNRATEVEPALERLVESTDASGTEWALAVQARCLALVADGDEAEALYCEALERLLPTAASPRLSPHPASVRRVAPPDATTARRSGSAETRAWAVHGVWHVGIRGAR